MFTVIQKPPARRSGLRRAVAWMITLILFGMVPFAIVKLGSLAGFSHCTAVTDAGICSAPSRLMLAIGLFGTLFPPVFFAVWQIRRWAGLYPRAPSELFVVTDEPRRLPSGLFTWGGGFSYGPGERLIQIAHKTIYLFDPRPLAGDRMSEGAYVQVICQKIPLGNDFVLLAYVDAQSEEVSMVGGRVFLIAFTLNYLCVLVNLLFIDAPRLLLASLCSVFALYFALTLWRLRLAGDLLCIFNTFLSNRQTS